MKMWVGPVSLTSEVPTNETRFLRYKILINLRRVNNYLVPSADGNFGSDGQSDDDNFGSDGQSDDSLDFGSDGQSDGFNFGSGAQSDGRRVIGNFVSMNNQMTVT
jgi:hypothetical protein